MHVPLGIAAAVYALLVVWSHVVMPPEPKPVVASPSLEVPAFTQEGVDTTFTRRGGVVAVHYDHRPARGAEIGASGRPVVVLIHGTPGSLSNFDAVAPRLNSAGYETLALDLPGFGGSTRHAPDIGILAHAKMLDAVLSQLGIGEAHVVGFSLGGGVALHLADLSPAKVRTVTLLASIGTQATEGMGSFHLEHAKYALGFGAVWLLENATPHFGRITGLDPLRAMLVNVFDTDQRPLREIMESMEQPVLILHGRKDPLVRHWAAEEHYKIIPTARLVMTPYSHFMPFRHPDLVAEELTAFFGRHDEPGVAALTDYDNRAPVAERQRLEFVLAWLFGIPWWFKLALIAVAARAKPETTTTIAGLLLATATFDFGLSFFGIVLGRMLTPGNEWDRYPVTRRLLTLPWTAIGLGLTATAFAIVEMNVLDPIGLRLNVVFAVPLVVLLTLLLRAIRHIGTPDGVRKIRAAIKRAQHHEWWPQWFIYVALIPQYVTQAIRTGHGFGFTAANPGVGAGGGVFGESKAQILDALRSAPEGTVLQHATITNNRPADVRAREAARAIADRSELGGYPIVGKPSSGDGGAGVRIIKSEADLERFFEQTPAEAVIQEFHAGPLECGVLWVRKPEYVDREPPAGERAGSIFMINRKEFRYLTGDGERTLRQLIWREPRLRCQREVFFRRFVDRLDEVVPAGETIQMSQVANHKQGTIFTDGQDLITDELERVIDEICTSFRGKGGKPFDIGRFDIRYESDELLRKGRGFAAVELNGVTSEPTSIYDPQWSPVAAVKMLYRYWYLLYEIGSRRIRAGERSIGLFGMIGFAVGAIRRERTAAD
ncbi:MAG: alpha/beta fold hydrolase [Planctomycetota bacterium]